MTESGKTSLCLALIIDPKGDLRNLLLTFPNVAPHGVTADGRATPAW